VRIPGWAGPKTSVAVNGGRSDVPAEPGKFMALKRTWKDGDRVEVEFEMPLRLEAIDDQNPNNVALVQGPLALFGVGDIPSRITKAQMLAASRVSQSSDDWTVRAESGVLTLRPFAKIMDEEYRLYMRVES
jgi:DUF1680 family protein